MAGESEPALRQFADPILLCRFLHAGGADIKKPEIWKALVRGIHSHRHSEALLFVLGLLGPALGKLADGRQAAELDADDVWQQTIACAMHALTNPRILGRHATLVGIVFDTQKCLGAWLRSERAQAEQCAPLLDLPSETNFDDPACIDDEVLLMDWWRRAEIAGADAALIVATRLEGSEVRSHPQDCQAIEAACSVPASLRTGRRLNQPSIAHLRRGTQQ